MQERNNLMKNKTKIAFLTTFLTMGLVLGACGPKPSSSSNGGTSDSSSQAGTSSSENKTSSSQGGASSSSNPSSSSSQASSSSQGAGTSSSSQVASKYTVTFVVDGKTVQTTQVNPGGTVTYEGDTPTKASGVDGTVYRFKGWDKDITQPINADTVFTAVFEESQYVPEIMVDDFESYDATGDMKDAGWDAWGYDNATQTWTTQTKAAVSLGFNSEEGEKALKFDAWENTVGYKFVKTLQPGAFTKSANALRFRLMTPSMNLVRVLLKGSVKIEGKDNAVSFQYDIHPTSNDYVEYTIPLADDNWGLSWNTSISIKTGASWMGVHEDDFLKYLTSVDFFLQGDDSSVGGSGYSYSAYLDSIKFVTLDNPQFTRNETIKQYSRYTGKLADGSTLRVDLGANGQATAKVIDIETPVTIQGTYAIENKMMTFASADNGASLVYKGNIRDAGKTIQFMEATGSFSPYVDDVHLNAVVTVDDFEQYTESGVAYSAQNYDEDARSGLRGAFYSEYYGEGRGEWGGNNWPLAKDGDEINLIQDANGAHSGNKYASLKVFNGNATRYLQWHLFKGEGERLNFRGSKFSFWAKGYVNKLSVYAFSSTEPTAASVGNNTGFVKKVFNEGNNVSEWTHIELDLNPLLVYHGFMLVIDKDYMGDHQLYIDDVEIYTADPYATYVAPLPPEPKHLGVGDFYLAKLNGLVALQLSFDRENVAHFMIPSSSTMVNGTYAVNEDDVILTFAETTYTATIADDYSKLTFKAVTGTDSVAQTLNGISFDRVDFAETGESYESAGTMYYESNTDESKISGARGAYYCDRWLGDGHSTPLGGNGWELMGGNGDQVGLEQGGPVGYQYPTFKRSSSASLRYIQWDLYKGTAKQRKGVDSFGVWLNNPANNEMKIKIYVFKNQQVNPANQTDRVEKEITILANQPWTFYTVPLNPETSYYGFGIYTFKGASDAYLGLDGANFYSVDNSPYIAYFAKNNMVLSGSTAAGEASIKFGTLGKAYLTCDGAHISNQQVSYTMGYGEAGQEMVISIDEENKIKGIYSVDEEFKVTFTVTEATGQFNGLVTVGAIFANQ